ncbi:hypothetical protein [Hymenobacter sp. APR13]|uniref:hypothetical protein n=1 Tax=Hymenobacter sp. APR13 TaxID=1356852 RepID=UPI0012E04756|nr:hypothetical protein [Hymenobacter sp. APR13]
MTTAQLLAKPFDRAGGIWELPDVSGCAPAEWLKFLQNYQQALQQVSRLHRNVLLVVVEDSFGLTQLPRRNQPQLAFHRYQQQLTQLDMLLFLSRVAPKADSAIERELYIHTVAALFPADAECALALLQEMPLTPEQITEFLEARQRERSWCSTTELPATNSDDAWSRGVDCYVDSRPIRHICAPAVASLAACVRQAQWLAQVRVLLPWIEQQRWQLLHNTELRHYLRTQLQETPYEKKFGEEPNMRVVKVSDPDRLEPAQMLYVLQRRHRPREGATTYLKSTKLHRKLETLLECRNEISHLSPLSENQIVSLLTVGE